MPFLKSKEPPKPKKASQDVPTGNAAPPPTPSPPPPPPPPQPPAADSSNEFDSPDIASASTLGSDSDIDTSAQQQERSSDKQKKDRKKAKKTLFEVAIGVYAVLCLLFFVLSLIMFIYLHTTNMEYFVRPPNEVRFYTVISDAYWDQFVFLCGILIHLVIAIFTFLLLVGCKKTGKMLSRYHEKLMLWVLITACFGEFLMFAGSVCYLSSNESVENGEFKDTVRPPPIEGCIHKNSSRESLETDYDASIHIRINLKWLNQVSCGYHTHAGKTSEKTMWKSLLDKSLNSGSDGLSEECKLRIEELEDAASNDCKKGNLLHITFHCWLVIDVVGILFLLLLFYIYMKAVVVDTSTKIFGRRNHHERLSFIKAEDAKEAEQVKMLTDKIKHYVVQELHSPAASKMASAMHLHSPNHNNQQKQNNHGEVKNNHH